MVRFLFSRVISASIVMLGVSCLVFLLIHLIPGDPVEVMLGETARPVDREALRQALGLNQPIHQQWWGYMKGLLHLDLGVSLHSKRPIFDLLKERFPVTFELTFFSLLVAVGLGFPLGVVAAVNKGTPWDYFAIGISILGVSIPIFWLGPLMILLFSYGLGWFPVSGREGIASIFLPAFTLGFAMSAILSRMVRSSLLEILSEDYIRTARAKGIQEWRVIWYHTLRNAMLPVITVLGLQLGALLGGTVIIEWVFSWPGIGQLTIEAIQKRDYPLVQGCVLMISLTYVLVNTGIDFVYGWLDPRIRLSEEG
ncbi:MAG TPA: nickel ABC transporter permease [Nitrospiria bacterium]|jgi:peptide/nickel transport system permease protein